jgi:hypothetical protein
MKLSNTRFSFLLFLLVTACGSSGESSSDGDEPSSDAGSSAQDGGSSTKGGAGSSSKGSGGSSSKGSGGSSSKSDGGSSTKADAGGSASADAGTSAGVAVDLGAAGDYVILAKSGISTVPAAAITGDLGVSPAAASYITGFSLTADASKAFSTSPQVTGKVYAADYAKPTPSKLTTAVSNMELAFTDAASRAADVTELGAGDIGGMALTAGVYKWGTGLLIPKDLTLDGSATDVWIFQISKDLTMSAATNVVLTGGALPKNVFWQVAGKVVLGTTAHLEGVVLTKTSITLRTGASLTGRLFAQTAVALDANTVVEPAP